VDTRPEPKDLSHHLSRATKSREASAVKVFYKYFAIPGIAQLAGGLPSNDYFLFDTIGAKIAFPNRWQPTPNRPVDPPSLDDSSLSAARLNGTSSRQSDAVTVPHSSAQTNPLRKVDIATALQYGTAQGYPPLYRFLREFTQTTLHPNCPYKGGPEIILTCGNTDGFSKTLLAFSNEWSVEKDWIRDRESILCEKFAFMTAIQTAKPRGLNVVPVEVDEEGMRHDGPGGLRDILENWDYSRGKLPHLMYTVTVGQNPTSGVLSLQRRRDIYALCSKYDVLIVEDDPYWYLQFPSATARNTTTVSDPLNVSFNPNIEMFANAEPRPDGWKSSGFKYLDSLVPSYINIDTDGRVIRLDTFSKIVAPGCRLGWLSAQPAFVERILRITETSTAQPSGLVQSMVAEVLLGQDEADAKSPPAQDKGALRQGWEFTGWVRWLEGLRGNYERRMNVMCQILESGNQLVKTGRRNSISSIVSVDLNADEWEVVEKTQMYSFEWPVGGMFIWVRLHFETHSLYPLFRRSSTEGLDRFSRALWVWLTKKPYLVLVAPGTMFSPTPEVAAKEGWQYFRLCFAAVDEEQIAPISQRFADAIAAFWKIKDPKVIEDLLQENAESEKMPAKAAWVPLIGIC